MSTDSNSSDAPQTIILQQPRESLFGRFGKWLLGALVLAILFCIGLQAQYSSYVNPPDGLQERFHSGDANAQAKIAVIHVSGTIIETNDFVKKQIDRVAEDDNVKAIVLRINSPGGTVTYSDYLHHHLRRLADGESRTGKAEGEKLPIVVSMGSVCASGGYLIAMAVGDQEMSIYAEPATITGSIGVIIPHYDFSGLMEEWKIKDDSIASHELKDMGSPTKSMTEKEREIFQALVDEMLTDFKEKIKKGRPQFRNKPEDLDAIATGQVFTAKQAEELGLIDGTGFIEDAIKRAAELAGVNADDVRCVEYKKPDSPLSILMGDAPMPGPKSVTLDIDSLMELNTPRAYYMSTFVPPSLKTE